ncbi:MAG: hypothetical protein V1911_00040, partial [Candidatus Micrarchaeota archaeon]
MNKISRYDLIMRVSSFCAAFIMLFSTFSIVGYTICEPRSVYSEPANVYFDEYAEKTADENTASLGRKINVPADGAPCDDDVWIDALDIEEYNALKTKISDVVTQIDAFGNKEQEIYNQGIENAGGTPNSDINPDDTKKLFIAGADGRPALVYDIMERKAVDPAATCSLNKLFADGKISYAAQLSDNMRYCASKGDECLGGVPSNEEATRMKDGIEYLTQLRDIAKNPWSPAEWWNRLSTGWKNLWDSSYGSELMRDAGISEADIKDAESSDAAMKKVVNQAIKNLNAKLEKSSTSSFADAKQAELDVNSDDLYLAPETRTAFLNFIKTFATQDRYTMAFNLISIGTGLAGGAAAAGATEAAGAAGSGGRFGSGALTRIKKFLRSPSSIREMGQAVSEAKTTAVESAEIGKQTEVIIKAFEAGGGEGYKATLSAGELAKKTEAIISEVPGDEGKIIKEINALNIGAQEKWSAAAELEQNGGSRLRVNSLLAQGDALSTKAEKLENAVATFDPETGVLNGGYEHGAALIKEGINEGEAGTSKIIQGVNEISDAADSVDKLTKPATLTERWARWTTGTSAFRGGLEKAGEEGGKLGKAAYLMQQLANKVKGSLFIKTLSRAQRLNFWTTMGIWYNNEHIRQPWYELTKVIFKISDETRDYTNGKDLQHYIEIDQTAKMPKFQTFVSGFVNSVFDQLGQQVKDSEKRVKARNIKDLVFIYDQTAYAASFTSQGTNGIFVDNTTGGMFNFWRFLSVYEDSARTITFENPKGYTNGGLSALAFKVYNTDIGGLLSEDQAKDQFTGGMLSPFISFGRAGRDLAFIGSTFLLFPIVGLIAGGGAGAAAGVAIGTAAGSTIMLQNAYDWSQYKYAELSDVKKAYESGQHCDTVFGKDEQDLIRIGKGLALALSATSSVTSYFSGTGVGLLISFSIDMANMAAMYFESEYEQKIAEKLANCAETSFYGIGFREMYKSDDVTDLAAQIVKPIQDAAETVFGLFNPGTTQEMDYIKNNMAEQALSVDADIKDSVTSVTGTETYYVHFKDSNIKWFQNDQCKIDLCQQAADGSYVCVAQNGYQLLDAAGKPIFVGPQALSMGMNLGDGYMSLVQNVVEIKKKDAS